MHEALQLRCKVAASSIAWTRRGRVVGDQCHPWCRQSHIASYLPSTNDQVSQKALVASPQRGRKLGLPATSKQKRLSRSSVMSHTSSPTSVTKPCDTLGQGDAESEREPIDSPQSWPDSKKWPIVGLAAYCECLTCVIPPGRSLKPPIQAKQPLISHQLTTAGFSCP